MVILMISIELLCYHVISGDIHSVCFSDFYKVEQQTLHFALMAACQILLHGGGAVRIQFVDDFQVVFH